MNKERPEVRQFALGEAYRYFRLAEHSITEYQQDIHQAEKKTRLTESFLAYNDALLSSCRKFLPSSAVNVLPFQVQPQLPRLTRILQHIAPDQPRLIQFESFYSASHLFVAYYADFSKIPSIEDLYSQAQYLTLEQMRARLIPSYKMDGERESSNYSPPLYDLERNPEYENADAYTFFTLRKVTPKDGFHLTLDRMEKVIDHLESFFREKEGFLPYLEERGVFLWEKYKFQKTLAAHRATRQDRVINDFKNVMRALHQAAERGVLKLPKEIVFPSEDGKKMYRLATNDGTLFAEVRSYVIDNQEYASLSGKTVRVIINDREYLDLIPALLRYVQTNFL
jgi:hypothetical protein